MPEPIQVQSLDAGNASELQKLQAEIARQEAAAQAGAKDSSNGAANQQAPASSEEAARIREDAEKLAIILQMKKHGVIDNGPTKEDLETDDQPPPANGEATDVAEAARKELEVEHASFTGGDPEEAGVPEHPSTEKSNGGFARIDPSFHFRHSDEWWEDQGWINFDAFDEGMKVHINWGAQFIPEWTESPNPFDLQLAKSQQVPLLTPGGFGQFENPVTGLPETISKQYGDSGTQWQFEFDIHSTIRAESKFGDSLLYGQLYIMTQNRKGGLDYIQTEDSGSRFDLETGDIEGFSVFETPTDTTRFGYHFYLRHLFPEFQLFPPKEELADDPHASHGMGDMLKKAILHPTLAVAVLGEFQTDPEQGSPNRTSALEPWANQLGILVASKDTGLFFEYRKLWDSYRRYWDDGNQYTFGVKVPLKTAAHMIGWKWGEENLADDFKLDQEGFPLAKMDTLFWDTSSFVIAYQWEDSEGSDHPLQGQFDNDINGKGRGSIGPGGPGGDSVSGDRGTLLLAFEANMKSDIEGKWGFLSDSGIRMALQFSDLDISSPHLPITSQIKATEGGAGGIFSEVPASIIPDTSGKEWSFTVEVEKRKKLRDMGIELPGYFRVGGYFDTRDMLGELTDNPIYDGNINTAGFVIGYTLANESLFSAMKR